MAGDSSDGDYLGDYSRFFCEFVARVNPDDQLPVKVSAYDLTEGEIIGEIINVTLQHLNQLYCPPSLQGHVIHLVIQEIKLLCKKQPEDCGRRHKEKTYAPLKLMQAVISKVNEICTHYTDNSRLVLLPPPPPTALPLVTAGATRNSRRTMEDRHIVLHDLHSIFNILDGTIANYYAVFDGHGGQDAAVYCATHLHQYLVESIHYPTNPEHAFRDAFLTTDAHFIEKSKTQKISGGTTAVCVLLINKKLYTAWVGDSMAMLVRRGHIQQLVKPHTPTREDETKRIRDMGGVVMDCMGIPRVNGVLSVSRAIGDVRFKPFMSGDPDIHVEQLDGTEDFVILACDGFWDFVNFSTATMCVYEFICQNPDDYRKTYQKLLQRAKLHGSRDNITVIVVFLTPPSEIASRSPELQLLSYQAKPNEQLNMDTNEFSVLSKLTSLCQQQGQYQDQEQDHPQQGHENGDKPLDTERIVYDASSRNGKHENGGADYDYGDLGPETNVDAVDDIEEVNQVNQQAGVTLIAQQLPHELFAPLDEKKLHGTIDNEDPFNDDKNDAPVDDFRPDENLANVDDDDSPPSPRPSKPLQHAVIPEADNVGDSEDSEDEWNYYRIDPNKEEDSATPVDETAENKGTGDEEVHSSQEIYEKKDIEHSESENTKKYYDREEGVSSELIDTEISPEEVEKPEEEDPILALQKREQEDMDFQLNPDAAEFVPISPPNLSSIRLAMQNDFPISGSPLKQPTVMDDIMIPSQKEFEEEVCQRPSDVRDEAEQTMIVQSSDSVDFSIDKQKIVPTCLDDSEISSTKAEFGDESATSFLTATEFHRTGISMMDESFGPCDQDDYDIAKDPMAMSYTPSDFELALSKGVDLNAVHDISGIDQVNDSNVVQNGVSNEYCTSQNFAELNNKEESLPEEVEDAIRTHSKVQESGTLEDAVASSCPNFTETKETSQVDFFAPGLEPFESSDEVIKKCDAIVSNPFSLHENYESTRVPEVDSFTLRLTPSPTVVNPDASDDMLDNFADNSQEAAVFTEYQQQISASMMSDQGTPCSLSPIPNTAEFTSPHPAQEDIVTALEATHITEEAPVSCPMVNSSGHSNVSEFPLIECSYDSYKFRESPVFDVTSVEVTQNPVTSNVQNELAASTENLLDRGELVCPFGSASTVEISSTMKDNICCLRPEKVQDNTNEKLETVVSSSTAVEQAIDAFELKHESEAPTLHSDFLEPIITPIVQQTDEILAPKNSIVEDHVPVVEDALPIAPSNEQHKEEKPVVEELTKISQNECVVTLSDPEIIVIDTMLPEEKVKAPSEQQELQAAPIAAAAILPAAGVAAAVAETTVAAPAKAKTAVKPPTKATTKRPTSIKTSGSTPTSPSKTVVGSTTRTTSTATMKKSATTSTRPRQLETSTKSATSVTHSKAAVSKTSAALPKSALTAKAPSRPASASTAARPTKSASAISKTSTVGGVEKKPTANGDVKPLSRASATRHTVKAAPVSTTTSAKPTGVVKAPSTNSRLISGTTKPRPTSAVTQSTMKSPGKPTSSTSTISSTSRPKSTLAPSSNATFKPRLAAGKSPVIDKQVKETANKQISMARSTVAAATATSKATRTSASSSVSTTTTTTASKRTSGTMKSTITSSSPLKKTTGMSKFGSKTSSGLKSSSATTTKSKALENGVTESVQITHSIITSANSNLEDDIPKKDMSPVAAPTDNQLIMTAADWASV